MNSQTDFDNKSLMIDASHLPDLGDGPLGQPSKEQENGHLGAAGADDEGNLSQPADQSDVFELGWKHIPDMSVHSILLRAEDDQYRKHS